MGEINYEGSYLSFLCYCGYHMEPVKDKSGFDLSVAESFDAPGKIILKPGGELVLE